ncbi:MAG: NAD(P)/FAD-dependent oxidoreductase [Patescibacteria group bacterium]
MTEFDVVIVGASFSGLTLAHHLDRSLKVLVIDAKPEPGSTVESTGLITTKTREEFKTFFDIDTYLTNAISSICVVAPSYEDFFVSTTQSPWIYQTDTRKLVQALAASVADKVEIRSKTVFVGSEEQEDGVIVRLREQGKEPETIRTKFLVGADGSHSAVAKSNPNLDRNDRFLFGYEQVILGEIHLGPHPAETIYHFWFGEFSLGYGGWLSPTIENGQPAFRIGLAKLEKDRGDAKTLLAKFIQTLVEHKMVSIAQEKPTYTFGSLIPINPTRRRFSTNRTLLIGDAAGFCGAFAADGIKGSVISGKLAADLITRKQKGERINFSSLQKQMNERSGIIDYYRRQIRYRWIWDQMKRDRTFDAMYQIIKRERASFLDQFCDSKDKHRSLTWTVLKWRHVPHLVRYSIFILIDLIFPPSKTKTPA